MCRCCCQDILKLQCSKVTWLPEIIWWLYIINVYIYLKTFNMDTQTLFSGVFMVTAQNGRTIASRIIQIKQYIHNTTTDTTQGWWLGVKTPGKDPRSKDPWFENPRKLKNLPFNPKTQAESSFAPHFLQIQPVTDVVGCTKAQTFGPFFGPSVFAYWSTRFLPGPGPHHQCKVWQF